MKRIGYIIALLLLPTMGFAQGDDFGIWSSVGAEKKISKRWDAGLEVEMRTRDNASTMDRWSFGAYGDYKVTSWLKASASYDLLDDNNDRCTYHTDGTINKEAKFWGVRHRFSFSLTGDVDLGNFNVSLRERWQYTYRPEKTISERYDYDQKDYDDEEHTYRGKGKNVLRSRLQVEYNIPNCKIEPYANVELYNAWSVETARYTVGADWKIARQHVVGLYYRYQKTYDDDDDEPNCHILGVTYKYKF
jgi:hypothetical protein